MPDRESTSRGFLQSVVLNAIEPGVNSSVMITVNAAFFLLLCTLAAMAYLTSFNFHVVVLGALTLVFTLAFNWFVFQLQDASGEVKSPEQLKMKRD